jgi:localization factor PodJL
MSGNGDGKARSASKQAVERIEAADGHREAADVRDLLRHVAAQIAEVDRRHGEAMRDFRARVGGVGQAVTQVRNETPPEVAPVMARIEKRLAEFVTAASATPRRTPADVAEPVAAAPSTPPPAPVPMPAPREPARAAHSPVVAAGEAAAVFVATVPAPVLVDRPIAAADSHGMSADTRIEARLAEVAQRVEEALAGLRPEAVADAVGAKVDEIDARLGAALDGVARRTDVEGLRIVEAHVTELAGHVEAIEQQLKRLDGIEDQLRELARFAAEAQASAPAEPTEQVVAPPAELSADSMQRIVEGTVDRLAGHLADVPDTIGRQAERVETLQRLIDAFVDERRREDRHTAGMLDTMQQALVHLIDRLEAAPPPGATALARPPEAAPEEEPARPFGRRPQVEQPPAETVEAQPAKPAVQGASATRPGQAAGASPARAPRAGAPAQPQAQPPAATPARAPADAAASRLRAGVEAAARPDAPTLDAADTRTARGSPARGPRQSAEKQSAEREPATDPAAAQPAVSSSTMRRGLAVVGVAFVLMGASALAHFYLSDRIGIRRSVEVSGPASVRDGGASGPAFADDEPADRRNTGARAPQRDDRRSNAAGQNQSEFPSASDDRPAERDLRMMRMTPPGIALQQPPQPVTATDLERFQQRLYNAQVSTNLGVNAGRPEAAGQPTPAVARPGDAARLDTSAVETSQDSVPGAELPPATLGPLSLRLAAQRGEPGAEFEIAARYAEGKGVKADFKKAMEWYQRAAQKGFVPAQYRLGTIYERGMSGKPDLQRARIWYKRAAEQGNVKAMHNLAVLSAGREGGSPDYPNAAQWFLEAAERGLSDSQFNLGVLHENGLGVPKDSVRAYKWYALAARSGDVEANRRRDAIQARMDIADVKAADDAVATWRAKATDPRANDARMAADAWRARIEAASAQPGLPAAATPPAAGQSQSGAPQAPRVIQAPQLR